MIKLKAIWKIIFCEHYIVLTADGCCLGCYPKNMKNLDLIKTIAEQIEKNRKAESEEAK